MLDLKRMTGCNYIDDYMQGVRDGSIISGEYIKMAMDYVQVVLSDDTIIIKTDMIERGIELIETYFEIKLFDWELFTFALVHCYYPDNTLVFNKFLIMMGRGNGKNGFVSPLVWYLTTEDHGIKNYNVDIIANSEDQAETSFEDVYEMLDDNWDKMKTHFYKSKTLIKNTKTKSEIKFHTSNSKTKDGKRSACLIFDEIHAYENYDLISVFTSGFGKKANTRAFYITTNGHVRDGVIDDELRVAKSILSGEITGLRTLPLLYMIDEEEDAKDPNMWHKANPSLKYFPELQREMNENFLEMKYKPHIKQEFYTKRLNWPTADTGVAVADIPNLMATNKPLPDLSGESCTCGIDYAKINDMVSVNLHFQKDGKCYDINHSWLCINSSDFTRIKPDKAAWVERGELTIIDDVEISPFTIADYIDKMMEIYDITSIAVDNYRYSLLRQALAEIGFSPKLKNLIMVRPSDIYKIVPVIESYFSNQKFVWGDHKLLRWATMNVAVVDKKQETGISTGNRYYTKIDPKSRKTDAFMALVFSVVIEEVIEETTPVPDFGVYVY